MEHVFGQKWIKIKEERISYYIDTVIFRKTKNGMIKYKDSGIQVKPKKYMPDNLYIRYEDRVLAYSELSNKFKKEITKAIESKDMEVIQQKLLDIATEIFDEPRHGSAIPASTLTNCIIDNYLSGDLSLEVFTNLIRTDYTTITHSMHVMALIVQYCNYSGYKKEKAQKLATAAMLHDIGKALIDTKIITSPHPLSDAERHEVNKHTTYGYEILTNLGLDYEAEIALKHHERLDGSGYPDGITDIDEDMQLIGIADSYEAMTSDHRLYAGIKKPYDALKEIRNEVDEGKFDMKIYSNFIRSLSGIG